LGSRGQTYRRMGRYEEALADYARALELEPDLVWVLGDRGETYRLMGRYEEALADLTKAVDLDDENDWGLYQRGLVSAATGKILESNADLSAAIRLAGMKYASLPHDWRNELNLALYHLAAGELDEAERLYQCAIENELLLHLAREAMADLDDLLRVLPERAGAKEMRSLLASYLGDRETP